jgi:D-mannonate dehydratase
MEEEEPVYSESKTKQNETTAHNVFYDNNIQSSNLLLSNLFSNAIVLWQNYIQLYTEAYKQYIENNARVTSNLCSFVIEMTKYSLNEISKCRRRDCLNHKNTKALEYQFLLLSSK